MTKQNLDILARVVPFAVYMLFVALLEIPTPSGLHSVIKDIAIVSYPIKILLVAAALILFRRSYTDMDWAGLRNLKWLTVSVGTGVIVFAAWINLDLPWAIQGELNSYDPTARYQGAILFVLVGFRVLGAAVIVPIMEELFWRSFLARYLAGKDFMRVRAGTFTLFSFAATAILFGLEHQLYLAGVLAGAAYNYVYWQTKSLSHCVLSHAVTNALLAVYVLVTRSWHFW